MADKQKELEANERDETLREGKELSDLEVPDGQSEEVKGGGLDFGGHQER